MSHYPYPDELKQRIDITFQAFLKQLNEADQAFVLQNDVFGIQALLMVSDYIYKCCLESPDLLLDQLKSDALSKPITKAHIQKTLQSALLSVTIFPDLMRVLRKMRHRYLMRIIWQDLKNLVNFESTMKALSLVAEVCIEQALFWIYTYYVQKYGEPCSETGVPQKMIVLALGKLGGYELNFSSDVDLLFCFPETGMTNNTQNSIDNQLFFNKLGQSLVAVLSEYTEDGFVYRVDMRLRPYGQYSALSCSFNAMEEYYQNQGRPWERYAFVKARPIAGDIKAGFQILSRLKPFIYKRYLDFSMINSVREMHALLQQEIAQKDLHDHLKKGRGGIRDIEFIVQSFQLIYGGKKIVLQNVSLLNTLNNIVHLHFMTASQANKLREAYLLLRRLEHFMQVWRDQQTYRIPSHPQTQLIIAWAMGYDSWSACQLEIAQVRHFVSHVFSTLLSKKTHPSEDKSQYWLFLFKGEISKQESLNRLKSAGFQDLEGLYARLRQLYKLEIYQRIIDIGLSRIYHFIPILISVCAQEDKSDQALFRMLDIVSSILRRTTYLVLLLERPEALHHLVRLCCGSLWITHEIVRYPDLIDEFFAPGDLYHPPSLSHLKQDLNSQISYLPWDAFEIRLERLCYFKLSHVLKNEIAQTSQYTPLIASSNYLSWVAESILNEVVNMAWHQLINKYGAPNSHQAASFVILAYGKLGGFEMCPSSDLDLVFIHDAKINEMIQGDQKIDNQSFFMRLGQKIIYFLSTLTRFGKLYEVDVRLRPSGNAGPLVSSFNAFLQYQQKSAWLWELQALVKARVVSGWGAALIQKLQCLRSSMLCRGYSQQVLQKRVKSYRAKMKILDRSSRFVFDIKQGAGGIIDVEFLVQYLVLKWAKQYPVLAKWTDNVRLLNELQRHHIITEKQANILHFTYIAMREVTHQTARQEQNHLVTAQQFIDERKAVIQLWNEQLDDDQALKLDH
ncbi:MAG: bifunctional [glutamate--ammonia ligase]-adenylyl-L-tyrosine phosphorylase/[glutamate--ammonia-ligase] adenylyltransferase [Endozoicomonadaceae bacterium]|nr:bifunctional [glutamate--ammonia ligase]-adenylyl-L-tyrosine phosphorylase/[glutamate--ammonia-ligase] adenylyltransferase [Endozoicomonadaceae bacterium]